MNELARRTGYSSGGVSKALAPGGDITWDFAAAVARAFDMSTVEVFRKAGLLSPRSETAERVAEQVSRLSVDDQYVALRIIQGLAQAPPETPPEPLRRVAEQEAEHAGDVVELDDLTPQILHKMEQLPDERRREIQRMIDEAYDAQHRRSHDTGPEAASA